MRILGILFTLVMAGVACKEKASQKPPIPLPHSEKKAPPSPPPPPEVEYKTHKMLQPGSTIASLLISVGLDYPFIHQVIEAAKEKVNMTQLPAGTELVIHWSDEKKTEPKKFVLVESKFRELHINSTDQSLWTAEHVSFEPEETPQSFQGEVVTSLWDSAIQSGMDPELILELSEIFAWQIDFNREIRKGDKWRLVTTAKTIKGENVGYGPIVAAEYQLGKETYTSVYFKSPSGRSGYFFPDGNSLRRMFLKSPLKFGSITSKFNKRRFHPVLKKRVPHYGVDYGAPVGTPVYSVGDGRVTYAGWNGPNGLMIKIKHNSTYKTAYLHLSKLAPGMKRGKRVFQGDKIGYVGATGRVTGPHLHFAFYERGRFVDPLGRKFPSADPVSKADWPHFERVVASALKGLPPFQGEVLTRKDLKDENDRFETVFH